MECITYGVVRLSNVNPIQPTSPEEKLVETWNPEKKLVETSNPCKYPPSCVFVCVTDISILDQKGQRSQSHVPV